MCDVDFAVSPNKVTRLNEKQDGNTGDYEGLIIRRISAAHEEVGRACMQMSLVTT